MNDARTIREMVSGSVEAMKREMFKMLINHRTTTDGKWRYAGGLKVRPIRPR
ncbi:hypothetical protein [Shewanella halifaxensis]|uniref:hypothetical protein n=1 Tax=Shewanella halifaxensis TaxID=271098 RepID=UPI001F430DDF|nr:hypothetical protein [Shewanella halifaxensis]